MSYPYGQPPHQPGYPAPGPGYPAPAYAAAPGPYGHPQPAPSGGTGITAGILALLGALSSVGMAISMFILTAATSESSLTNGAALATGARRRSSSSSSSSSSGTDVDIDFEGVGIIWGILYLIVAVALLVGGIMLLKRSSAGRTTVIVACVAFLIVSIFGFGITAIIAGLFALGTLILASLGSTKRWIDAARMPAAPAMAGGYGPAPYGY
ncbi:hypothetical protein [Nocardia carnea]|uniref:DUF4064 domain-containing protein n=1 Tax=Nocardia carnea TaxID=37328 RepID=A0ABW7TXI8_9NOCA|nr:hypothetical protein [Nocardia carnea]